MNVNIDACSNVFRKFVNQLDDLELTLGYDQQVGDVALVSLDLEEIKGYFGGTTISSLLSPGMASRKLFSWINRYCQGEYCDP
jgi:hypothetical protein